MTANAKITTLIFDIGNVLIHHDYRRAADRLVKATGLPLETIEKHFFFSEWERRYSKGEVSSEEFYAKISGELGLTIGYETFSGIWNDIFWENSEMAAPLKALKGRYLLVCISNTNDLHFRHWREQFPVLRWIDIFFPSHELGLRKPDPEIFRAVCEKLAIRAEEAVFIDDVEENVRAAQDLGMRGVVYHPGNDFYRSLKEAGIEL